MYRRIEVRHRAVKLIRDFLDAEGFLEIETPIITKSTPEGARDYLVPYRLDPGLPRLVWSYGKPCRRGAAAVACTGRKPAPQAPASESVNRLSSFSRLSSKGRVKLEGRALSTGSILRGSAGVSRPHQTAPQG